MKFLMLTLSFAVVSTSAGAQTLAEITSKARAEMSRLNSQYRSKSAALDLQMGFWYSKVKLAEAYEGSKAQLEKCGDPACLNLVYDRMLDDLADLSFRQGMTNENLNDCFNKKMDRDTCGKIYQSTRDSISLKKKAMEVTCSKPGLFGFGAIKLDVKCVVPLKKELVEQIEEQIKFSVESYVLGSQMEGSFKCLKMLYDRKDLAKGLTPSDVENRKKAVQCAFSLERNQVTLYPLVCNRDGSDFSEDFKASEGKPLSDHKASEVEALRSLVMNGPYTDCSGLQR